jgi:hypothetical protein
MELQRPCSKKGEETRREKHKSSWVSLVPVLRPKMDGCKIHRLGQMHPYKILSGLLCPRMAAARCGARVMGLMVVVRAPKSFGTNSDEMVAVDGLDEGGHFSDPGIDQGRAIWGGGSVATGLVDQVEGPTGEGKKQKRTSIVLIAT